MRLDLSVTRTIVQGSHQTAKFMGGESSDEESLSYSFRSKSEENEFQFEEDKEEEKKRHDFKRVGKKQWNPKYMHSNLESLDLSKTVRHNFSKSQISQEAA